MNSTLKGWVVIAALTVFSGAALAQNPNARGTYLGLEVGAYLPSDNSIKSAFGSTLPRIGINFINNQRPEMWKPMVNFSVIGANKNGNRFLLIPVTVGLGRQFGSDNSSARPYIRAGAGLAYVSYAIGPTGSRVSDNTIQFTGAAEGGVLLSDRVRISAAYNYFPKQNGFDFSGWEVKVSFLFWKI